MAVVTFIANKAAIHSINCNLHGQIITEYLKVVSPQMRIHHLDDPVICDVHATSICKDILSNVSINRIIASRIVD